MTFTNKLMVPLLAAFSIAGQAAEPFPTFGGKISKAPEQGSDPIVSLGEQRYMGQLKSSVQNIAVGCNKLADGKDCQPNPKTGRDERIASAICNRVAAISVEATRQSGAKETLVFAKGTISFFNLLMLPAVTAQGQVNNFTGIAGDVGMQPQSVERFKTHLMNPPETRTQDLGGPGHSMLKRDITGAESACGTAHNNLTP